MAALTFQQPQLLQLGEWRFTDHNRAELQITPEQIENANRMVDGTMRKQVIAVKRTFTVSWENLPGPQWATVDGFFGADDIINFYNSNVSVSVNLTLQYGQQLHDDADTTDLLTEVVPVFFTDCTRSIIKRGFANHNGQRVPMALYSLNLTMVEV